MIAQATVRSLPTKLLALVNLLILLVTLVSGFGLIAILWDRQSFLQISQSLFSAHAPLMNSPLADALMHKWVAVIVAISVFALIVKEFRGGRLGWRLLYNLGVLVLYLGFATWLGHLLYAPVIQGGSGG